MKKILRLCILAIFVFVAYERGKIKGEQELLEFYGRVYEACVDPNYDPNDWIEKEPNDPVIYIDAEVFRLQPGSSIKYVEIYDPCVVVSYHEPRASNGSIEFNFDPNTYGAILIKNCSFNMTDPNGKKTGQSTNPVTLKREVGAIAEVTSKWFCANCLHPIDANE